MSNHSWQRLEIACLDWGACLPLCSGAQIPSVTSFETTPALNAKEETLEYGPRSAQPPALGIMVRCHSVSLGFGLPNTQYRYYTAQQFCGEDWPVTTAIMKLGGKCCCYCYKPNSWYCVQLLLKYKQYQKSLSGFTGALHAFKSNDRLLCPSINFATVNYIVLVLMTTVHILEDTS